MNAVQLLKDDHRTVENLFRRYELSSDTETKREIVEQIIRELSIHAAIEEQVLYPETRREVREKSDLADEGLEEHREVKETLSDLDGMDAGEAGFDAKVRALIADVRHHVEEEEGELFPALEEALTKERLDDLGTRMDTLKRIAPTRPHPRAPDQPAAANLAAGAAAGIVDRARDAVSGRKKAQPKSQKKTQRKTTRKTQRKTTQRRPASRAKAVYRVVPDRRQGGWKAEKRGSSRAVARGDRKDEVVQRAREVARSRSGRLVIHTADGRVQEERTY